MPVSLSTLGVEYAARRWTPVEQVRHFLRAADDATYAAAWIHRVDPQQLLERAAQLEALMPADVQADPQALARLPLYGALFAVKDNIDVAGIPTTAACREFAYVPSRSAAVIERLQAAGAILVGKTNLDQFATGLVGTRSPYGAVPNAFNANYISGGSSSGSALAVAKGWVSFALGTDTAGSGRVPAALNNIVGLKPTRGMVSARGVVPACQSLDCVSIFATTVPDALRVLQVLAGVDAEDPWSRPITLDRVAPADNFRFAVPRADQLEFFDDAQSQVAFQRALTMLERCGGEAIEIDFTPFLAAAALLYEGPWVAERLAAIRPFFERAQDKIHPVVRAIIGGGREYSAADLFAALTRLEALKKQVAPYWTSVDALVVPTAATHYTIDRVLADPFECNRRLGYYTNFVNLLDLAAIAVPAGLREDGLPFGVSLIGPAGSDLVLATLGQRVHQSAQGKLGATAVALPPLEPVAPSDATIDVAVVGAHLSGQPLNWQLTQRHARLLRRCRTAPSYRLYALADSVPAKPGLIRATGGAAHAIELEVWRIPVQHYGSFVALIPSPLGIGRVELEDGNWVQGFLCEPWALAQAEEISVHGGWRAWLTHRVPAQSAR